MSQVENSKTSDASGSASESLQTPRVTLRRRPDKAHYDFETIAKILDRTYLCHVGFVVDGQPYVIPTNFGRQGRRLFIHGSAASRMLLNLTDKVSVCITVTLLDGLVLARSIFNHSVNHESVVILGQAKLVPEAEKLAALEVISEQAIPGRWKDARAPNAHELSVTSVLEVEIAEASAKVRKGPPMDDEEDLGYRCWAGELPLRVEPQSLVADPRMDPSIAVPDYLLPGIRKRPWNVGD